MGQLDEMIGWHHRLNGHEFEQASGDSDGRGNLACCTPWSRKEQLNKLHVRCTDEETEAQGD